MGLSFGNPSVILW